MKTKFPTPPHDRTLRPLVAALATGLLVFLFLVLMVLALLAAGGDADAERDSTSRYCPGQVVGTVDPVTCLPYVGPAGVIPGSSAQKPTQSRPKTPAAPKAPSAPKAPAAPAAKIPAAPPVRVK